MRKPEKTPAARRITAKRTKVALGVAGLAAVLGGTAYAVTDGLTDDDPVARPADPSVAAAPAGSGGATPSPDAAAPTGAAGSPAEPGADVAATLPPPKLTRDEQKRVDEARRAAAKAGVKIARPLPQSTLNTVVADVKVADTGSLQKDKRTMRVVTARGDLSGYRELAWVADRGTRVGDSTCSQTIRLSNDNKPQRQPNLLICWRTSAKKSAYTVTVDLSGKPSKEKSVAAIDEAWRKLG